MQSQKNGLSRHFDADGKIISSEALTRKLRKDNLLLLLLIPKREKGSAVQVGKVKTFLADEDRKIGRLLGKQLQRKNDLVNLQNKGLKATFTYDITDI